MARDLKIDAAIEAVPSPQWVKDRSSLGDAGSLLPYKSKLQK